VDHIRVVALDHIVLWSADVERSVAFYRDILGCTLERYDEWRRGEAPFPSVRLTATTIIDVFAGGAPGAGEGEPRNLHHLCLAIAHADMSALAASLRDAGVVVEGEPVTRWGARGDGTSLYVRDPDGNLVELKTY